VTELLNQAEYVSQQQGDNMSAIGLQWGDKLSSSLAVSTVTMAMGSTTTIINPVTNPSQENLADDGTLNKDLTADEIEDTIKEIQEALRKTQRI
jgi:hypothetical protein